MSVSAQEDKKFDCYLQTRNGGKLGSNILMTLPQLEGYNNTGCVINEKKEMIETNAIIDIYTFIGSKGWEYVTQITELIHGTVYTWHIFKKKVTSIKEVYEEFPLHTNVDGAQQ